jgi:NAD(P)H dehydrogenase (quinone)
MKKFWEDLLPDWQKIDGKIGCAFSSEGGWGGGAELTCQTLMTIMLNFDHFEVLTFDCYGT